MNDEKAKAVQEASKFGVEAADITKQLGGYLARVFGTMPEDIVGLVVGDWLRHLRIRNLARINQRTEEILKEREILDKTEPVSPSIALPLLQAAQDETREELRELWARMLANAMDPSRSSAVRQSIINTVKAFDPLDAILISFIGEMDEALITGFR